MATFADLAPAHQDLVADLSVFDGGFTPRAARAVAGPGAGGGGSLDAIFDALVATGTVEELPGGGERLRLAPAIHQAAAAALQRSGRADAVRARHLDWAAAFALDSATALEGPDQVLWLDDVESERANLVAALAWGVSAPGRESALTLAGALGRFWEIRGHTAEGSAWLEQAITSNPEASTVAHAMAANSAGLLALRDGNHAGAEEHYNRSLALHWELGDRLGSAGVLHSLGNLAFQRRDVEEAERLFGESLAIGRDLHDLRVIGASLSNLGAVADVRGDPAAAIALYDEALAVWRRQGDSFNEAAVGENLLQLAIAAGDDERARRLGEEALAARRLLGDSAGVGRVLKQLEVVATRQHDAAAADRFRAEARALRKESGGWLSRLRRPGR